MKSYSVNVDREASIEWRVMPDWRGRSTVFLAAVTAASVVGFDLLRMFRNYSPVPYWDMWIGYLGFMRRLSTGEMSAWWAPHNEHRIVLSRLLFWIDMQWFEGQLIFLLVANVLLVTASAYLFTIMLREIDHRFRYGARLFLAPLLITSWLFLGMQYQNLDWEFQSQFFLAQLLPLSALFLLSQVSGSARPSLAFLLTCTVGVAACGTMANGILALPLMTLFAAITGLGWRRTIVLMILSIVMATLYFGGLHLDGPHGSLPVELMNRPSAVALFTLIFLGSPLLYLMQWWADGGTALVGGLCFVGLVGLAAISWCRDPSRGPIRLALLLFCVYVMASGVLIAGGRLEFGVAYGLSSRYTTPVVMAWVAVAVLFATSLVDWISHRRLMSMILMIVLEAAMVRLQWHAKDWSIYQVADQDLAGLALTLGVNDVDALIATYPISDQEVEHDAAWARSAQRSFFLAEPFHTLAQGVMGQAVPMAEHGTCVGHVRGIHRLNGDSRFVRVSGWWPPTMKGGERRLLLFLDRERTVIGVAITDPAKQTTAGTRYEGYLSAVHPTTITAHGGDSECERVIELPASPPADAA